MVNMNDSMKKLLQESRKTEEVSKINQLSKDVVNRTKLIRDCIIFDETGEIDETKINFNQILKFVKDWTGYEISCNELRFSKKEIPSNDFLYFTERLNINLSEKYEGRKFGIIISIIDEKIDLRFHTYREKEGLWLDKDLNKYNNPILYRVEL